MSPQTASLENLDRPVQPTSFVEPPGRVNPKETLSDTQATEDMPQATRPNSRGIQWWWDLDPLYIERDSETISSAEVTLSSHDRSPLRILPFKFRSNPSTLPARDHD